MTRKSLTFAAVLLAATSGCHSTPTLSTATETLSRDLRGRLEVRTDPSKIRLMVYEIHAQAVHEEDTPHHGVGGHGVDHGGDDERDYDVAEEIEHELVVALSSQFTLLESEHPFARNASFGRSDRLSETELDLFRQLGATAVVVGDYFFIGYDTIRVGVRVVDLETNVILAAAMTNARIR